MATAIRLPGDVVFKINNAGDPLLQELMEGGEVGQLAAPAGDQSRIGERGSNLLGLKSHSGHTHSSVARRSAGWAHGCVRYVLAMCYATRLVE